MWKHFGFTVSGNEKTEKVANRKQYADTACVDEHKHAAFFLHILSSHMMPPKKRHQILTERWSFSGRLGGKADS